MRGGAQSHPDAMLRRELLRWEVPKPSSASAHSGERDAGNEVGVTAGAANEAG